MRIGICALVRHKFYLRKVIDACFYLAFLNLTNSSLRKFMNQSWLFHKGRYFKCVFHFRLHRFKSLQSLHLCAKFCLKKFINS